MATLSLRAKLSSARLMARDPLLNLVGVVENVTTTSRGSAAESSSGAVENVFLLIIFCTKSVTLVQAVGLS